MNELANWRDEYPFDSHWESIDGHRYHFLDEGSGDSSLLAVHGNPTWSFYWRSVVSRFRNRCRVVAVDHLGCGLSDKPQRYDYCLRSHASNLGQLIQAQDLQNITLLAHDWGGAIGLLALTEHRHRFSRLILLNTGAFPPPFVPWRIGVLRFPLLGTLAIRGLNAFAGPALSMTMNRHPLSATAKQGLAMPYGNWHDRVAVDRFVRDIPLTKRHRTWQVLSDLEASLSQLADLPAMFVWGMKDWCFRPECMDRLQQAMPRARQVPIDDAGHYVMEDATEDVLAAIESFIAF